MKCLVTGVAGFIGSHVAERLLKEANIAGIRKDENFTFIQDVVDANLLAMKSECVGDVFNIGGGSEVSVNKTIEMIEEITGLKAYVNYHDAQKGDVIHTSADITKARKILGYSPKTGIYEGLTEEVEWMKSII